MIASTHRTSGCCSPSYIPAHIRAASPRAARVTGSATSPPCCNGYQKRWQLLAGSTVTISGRSRPHGPRQHVNHLCRSISADQGQDGSTDLPGVYDLESTKAMVETAMLAAVAGLCYILATTVKLENSVGYFLPLPVVVAAMRSGAGAGFKTAMATFSLLMVVMGPLRAVAYLLLHGMMASTLGALWKAQVGWLVSVPVAAVVRMVGQGCYLLLTCFTLNENIFMALLANVHAFLDQASASMGMSGAPSTLTVACMIFAMLLVNSVCYVFLLHIIYRMVLQSMGFQLGPLPAMVRRYMFAGAVQ